MPDGVAQRGAAALHVHVVPDLIAIDGHHIALHDQVMADCVPGAGSPIADRDRAR
jgi:hypothetical protein